MAADPGVDAARPVAVEEAGGAAASRSKPKKAAGAFRTISEVADELHIPQHVLRFWETKFSQVRPLKRGGGRRYYRPDDILLLRRISDLLYTQGYTIKGVQRLLREGGGKLSDDIPPPTEDEQAEAAAERAAEPPAEPELPMPGLLAPEPPPPSRAPPSREPASRELGRPRAPEAVPAFPAEPDGEVERLRALLRHTLAELESIRALLRR